MATVAVVTATAVLASTTSPAFADPIRVGQGETITLPWDCIAFPTVIPSNAGTVSYSNNCTLLFTASLTYSGPVELTDWYRPTLEYEVTPDESASIGATFTPTAAPGPCLQIVSGANVSFGDVTPGPAVLSEFPTEVQSCAQTDITLTAAVSPATSGGTVWQPDRVTDIWAPDLNPNTFAYQMNGVAEGTQYLAALDTVPRAFVNGFTGGPDLPLQPGTTRLFAHLLAIGSGSSGLGQQFSTTVTLTATAA